MGLSAARLVVVVAFAFSGALAGCTAAPSPRPDREMKPDGETWFCSTEVSGMLSVCERTRKKCKRAKKYLYGLSHRRGEQMTLGACKKQPRAHCLTAERRLPKAPSEDDGDAVDEDSEDESDSDRDGEADESEREAAAAEAGEAEDEAREVVEDTLWLCYASRDHCEWQRKNMYYFGFTHVSRCGRWR